MNWTVAFQAIYSCQKKKKPISQILHPPIFLLSCAKPLWKYRPRSAKISVPKIWQLNSHASWHLILYSFSLLCLIYASCQAKIVERMGCSLGRWYQNWTIFTCSWFVWDAKCMKHEFEGISWRHNCCLVESSFFWPTSVVTDSKKRTYVSIGYKFDFHCQRK